MTFAPASPLVLSSAFAPASPFTPSSADSPSSADTSSAESRGDPVLTSELVNLVDAERSIELNTRALAPRVAAELAGAVPDREAAIPARGALVGLPTARNLASAAATSRLYLENGPAGPAVTVLIDAVNSAPAARLTLGQAVARLDGRTIGWTGGSLEATLPVVALQRLAREASIGHIRPLLRPIETTVNATVSKGVSLHGADAWQAAGITGTGVKIGILDNAFSGLAARLGTELPATIVARCYTAPGTFTTNLSACATDGDDHGTAVAETIFDMAPGATFYISNAPPGVDELATIGWMTANGVRIINASRSSGELFDGPGDGTSPYSDSIYRSISKATSGGALWVNAAGNEGMTGWSGAAVDANANGWLEFVPGIESDPIAAEAGEDVVVAIRWPEVWGKAASDYDLYLYPPDGSTPVASSEDIQSGSGDPFEVLDYVAPVSGEYGIRIRLKGDPAVKQVQLLAYASGDLRYRVADGTLPSPADSADPAMLTVGAVNVATPSTVEPYSSRGPTMDGRTKPDLVAGDCAITTVEAPFCGTSQSAPYVSGAAALVRQSNPSLTPAQLASFLRSHTVPVGPLPNNAAGFGRLALGPPPGGVSSPSPVPGPSTSPSPSPSVSPHPSTPPALQRLSDPAAGVAWRALALGGSSIHVAFARPGTGAASEVVYRRSVDAGAGFSEPTVISTPGVEAGYPAIASAGSSVVAAWVEGDLAGTGDVLLEFARSQDGGSTWTSPVALDARRDPGRQPLHRRGFVRARARLVDRQRERTRARRPERRRWHELRCATLDRDVDGPAVP